MAADFVIKVIVLGESGVGKTSLLLRYATSTFKPHRPCTIIDCINKVVKINDKLVKFELWDTAGQEKYKSVIKQYYRIANGVLLVYDVTNIATFHKLSSWLEELRSLNEQATVIIVGNKTDSQMKKAVAVNAVKSFAEQESLEFLEVSAKKGENVDEIFEYLAMKVLAAGEETKMSTSTTDSSVRPVSSKNIKTSIGASPSSPDSSETPPSSKNTEHSVNKTEEISKEPEKLTILPTTGSVEKENPTRETECRKRKKTDQKGSRYPLEPLPPIVALPKETIDLRVKIKEKSDSGCC